MQWFDKKDDERTILNHLGKKVPDSIQKDAERELKKRGWSDERIREESWNRD